MAGSWRALAASQKQRRAFELGGLSWPLGHVAIIARSSGAVPMNGEVAPQLSEIQALFNAGLGYDAISHGACSLNSGGPQPIKSIRKVSWKLRSPSQASNGNCQRSKVLQNGSA